MLSILAIFAAIGNASFAAAPDATADVSTETAYTTPSIVTDLAGLTIHTTDEVTIETTPGPTPAPVYQPEPARASAAVTAPGVPVPEVGKYTRAFMTVGTLNIEVTQEDMADPSSIRFSVWAALPGISIIEILDSPITFTSGPTANTSAVRVDNAILSSALVNTNAQIGRLQYRGSVTPERLEVVYFPQGRTGDSDPSLYVVVSTDAGVSLFRGHAILE